MIQRRLLWKVLNSPWIQIIRPRKVYILTYMPPRIIKYTEALKEATDQMMEIDRDIFVIGLGVSYKNGADGTTSGLKIKICR